METETLHVARQRSTLVLGAGGFMGAAWMLGTLQAIHEETGWDPRTADCVVGTSAGALVGALLAGGLSPRQIVALAREPSGQAVLRRVQVHWSFPRPVLGSPELAFRSLLQPWRYGPLGIIGWLPQGVISTEPLQELLTMAGATDWPADKRLWVVAIDYATGERVAFGRDDDPRADLPAAAAASCAVPGFYFPVAIEGRRYVDGGMYSTANLDLACGIDSDLTICLHPMSSRFRGRLLEPTGRIATIVRGNPAGRLDREVARLTRLGRRVLVLEPHAADVRAMGYNYMSADRAKHVLRTARQTAAGRLRGTRLGRTLAGLAEGSAQVA